MKNSLRLRGIAFVGVLSLLRPVASFLCLLGPYTLVLTTACVSRAAARLALLQDDLALQHCSSAGAKG